MMSKNVAIGIAKKYLEEQGVQLRRLINFKRHSWLCVRSSVFWHFFVETADGKEVAVAFCETDPERSIFCRELCSEKTGKRSSAWLIEKASAIGRLLAKALVDKSR